MSPEQIREARDVDARSDIFALGVLLYELSSGRVPFHGSSVADLHAAILMQQPTSLVELNPKIPAEFAAVVAKCLAKDRFERFQNVAELARALVPFAPPRAKQYGDRISRIIHASTAFPSLSAQFGGPDSAPGVDRSSESGRLPKVRLALSGSGAYRVTPSDAVRISNPEGGLDSGRDSRELVETLVPVRSSHPPPVRRSRLPVVGIGVAVVAIAVTALVLLATLRTGGSVAAGADVAPPDPLRSEASTPSGPPSAVTVVDIASAASGLPIADSGAPSKPQPVRPAAATTATGGSGIKVSKPPPAKTDEFDPYGTRK
jgi:serine/threonine-protein kinase